MERSDLAYLSLQYLDEHRFRPYGKLPIDDEEMSEINRINYDRCR